MLGNRNRIRAFERFCGVLLSCILWLTFWLVFIHTMKANVGQPGIWEAGGGMRPLFVEDSLAQKTVSMTSERVDIFLYSGFAIVHGNYTLVNRSTVTQHFRMGYPINELQREGYTEEPFGHSFRMDSLASFEVTRDGSIIAGLTQPYMDEGLSKETKNWIIWDITFTPEEESTIEVTFVIPTDRTYLTNLHGKREANGLVYIFESGTAWKGPIGRVELYVHFYDGLSSADILGIRPCGPVEIESQNDMLRWRQSNWEPASGENFYLLYERRKNKYYSFREGVEDQQNLYKLIKQKISFVNDENVWSPFECKDILKTETTNAYARIVAMILGGSVIVFILLAIGVRKLNKIIRS